MTDKQDKALLDVVSRIPPTWTCIRCKREFRNGPDGVMPWGMQTKDVPIKGTYRFKRVVVGQICKRCWSNAGDLEP